MKNLGLLFLIMVLSCQKSVLETSNAVSTEIDNYVDQIKTLYGVPGIGLAILKNGKIIHQKNYGFANLEHQVKLSDSSSFRLYSLTKPIISVGIFQLIEKGKLRLDDKIFKFIKNIPETWKTIQVKHLLSFSSGLPELIEPYKLVKDLEEDLILKKAFKDKIRFKAGERFEYNQTNFWILQKIIEEITGSNLSDYIVNRQFNSSKNDAFFSSDARDIIRNRVTPYFPFDKGVLTITHPYYQGNYSNGMNGLHLTLKEFIVWDKNFNKNLLISKSTKKQMWSAFPYKNEDVFTFGWGAYLSKTSQSYGFSGSGSTIYRTFPNENTSIIYLSNGFERAYDLNKVIDELNRIIN